MQIADRVDKLSQDESYITLKDHKDNFQNNPKVRLINPSKTQIGKISKQYVQDINNKLIETTCLNQWKCTTEVIKWFENKKTNNNMSFLQLDIVDFYPSISQELLDNSLLWAKSLITIDADVISTITNARKTLLFSDGVSWQKNTGLSDVTQGGLDSCQMCELVKPFETS